MLLTEMAWQDVPKDLHVQRMRGIPRGMDHLEMNPHRLRYDEVSSQKRGAKVGSRWADVIRTWMRYPARIQVDTHYLLVPLSHSKHEVLNNCHAKKMHLMHACFRVQD